MGMVAFSIALFAKPCTVGNNPGKVRSFNVQEIMFGALLFQLPETWAFLSLVVLLIRDFSIALWSWKSAGLALWTVERCLLRM